MHGARFACEAGAEALEHRQHRGKRVAQSLRRIAVVVPGRLVVGERHRIFDLVRNAVEGRRQSVPVEHRHEPGMKRGDAPRIEREFLAGSVAGPQHDRVAAEVEHSVKVRSPLAAVGSVSSPFAFGCSATCQP